MALRLEDAQPALRGSRLREVLEAFTSAPGSTVAVFGSPFLENAQSGSPFRLPPGVKFSGLTEMCPVSSDFFSIMGLRPTDGRIPTRDEFTAGRRVMVVSEKVARQYWPGLSPLGRLLDGSAGTFEVVGVVPDARYQALDRTSPGEIYVPIEAVPTPTLVSILIRPSAGEGADVLRQRIERAAGRHSVLRVSSVAEDLGRSFAPRRFLALLCGSFAVLALVIIGAGVAGNAGMDVSARKKELAIRMAVGATRVSLVALVARRHLQPVLVGGLFGGILAAWSVRSTQAYLYEMSPYDFRVWSAAVVLVSIAALVCAVGATLKIVRLAPLIHLQEN